MSLGEFKGRVRRPTFAVADDRFGPTAGMAQKRQQGTFVDALMKDGFCTPRTLRFGPKSLIAVFRAELAIVAERPIFISPAGHVR